MGFEITYGRIEKRAVAVNKSVASSFVVLRLKLCRNGTFRVVRSLPEMQFPR